jgi:hypothetical protein
VAANVLPTPQSSTKAQLVLANPKCTHCGKNTERYSRYEHALENGGSCKIGSYRCRDHKYYAFLVLSCHGELAQRLGVGVFEWTCEETGDCIRTALPRKRGTRLLPPDVQFCPECGSNRQLQGPNQSERLGEPFWVLRCPHRESEYFWRPNPKLQPLPPEVFETLHSRNRYQVPTPRCPRCDRKMNPQKKEHLCHDGGLVEILHFRCRVCKEPQDLFSVLPQGHVAKKDGLGIYRWKDEKRQDRYTVRRRAQDRTSVTWQLKAELKKAEQTADEADRRVIELREKLSRRRSPEEASFVEDGGMTEEKVAVFARLFTLPQFERDARRLLRTTTLDGFTRGELQAAAKAVNVRPACERPTVAARHFVAGKTGKEYSTVAQHHREYLSWRDRKA